MTPSLSLFEEEDAFISNNIEANVEQYVNDGGDIAKACEALEQSYEGNPEILRILIDWIDLYGNGMEDFERALERVMYEHEPTFVSRLDEGLSSSDSQPVLASLVSDNRWSTVVTKLAESHRGSVLHSMLMREKRLLDAGVNLDVISSPTEFMKAVESQFKTVFTVSGQSGKQLLALYQRISALSTYDEASTVLALRVFSVLADAADDTLMKAVYQRMSEEIRKEAVKVIQAASSVAETEARQYVIRLAVFAEFATAGADVPRDVLDSLLRIVMGIEKHAFDKEIDVLNSTYGTLLGNITDGDDETDVIMSVADSSFNSSEKALLIRMLCFTEVFDGIMKTLFSHRHRSYMVGRQTDARKRKCLSTLLAYIDTFSRMGSKEIHANLQNEDSVEILRRRVVGKSNEIDIFVSIIEELKPGSPRYLMKQHFDTLLKAAKDPLQARGVLVWACEGLKGGEDARALAKTAPTHLAFLQSLAEYHEVLRPQILDAIHASFMMDYPGLDITQIEDMRDMFVRHLLSLLKVQMAPLVVQMFLENWADEERVDRSHLRRFVQGLLESIAPPYSKRLISLVLRLLRHKRVASAIVSVSTISKYVVDFRKEALEKGMG